MEKECPTCYELRGKLNGRPFILKDLEQKEGNEAIRGQLVKRKKQSFLNVWVGTRIVRTEINYCHVCGRKL
ncbi:hypothetical protein P7H60_13715 [Vagococcus carniphilus]|uniref:hypothetical protein n=1 Tax=Vagococcus carniphilus TaxID=218144 RepID=UPI00288C795D|nr:hypothetical protein [Vagococcus carniphilus]MDT2850207.1 hypothetical protein [Vagococcus carniphilus]